MRQRAICQQWQLLTCFAISLLVWGGMGASLGPLLPFLSQHFTLSLASVGQAFIGWSTGFCLGSLCAARLIIKISPFLLIFTANLIASLCVLGMATVNSFGIYCLFYTLTGVFGGLLFTSSHTLASYVFLSNRRAVLSLIDFSFSIGTLISPLLIGLTAWMNWQWQFLYQFIAAGLFLSSLLIFVCFPIIFNFTKTQKTIPVAPVLSQRPFPQKNIVLLLSLFSIFCFLLGFSEWQQNVWLVSYLISLGLSVTQASIIFSGFSAGMLCIRGMFILSFKKNRPVILYSGLALIILLAAVGLTFGTQFFVMLMSSFLFGIGIGSLLPGMMSSVMSLMPRKSAVISSVAIISLTLGGQLSSFATGKAVNRLGMLEGYRQMNTSVLLLILILGVLCYRLRTTSTHQTDDENITRKNGY